MKFKDPIPVQALAKFLGVSVTGNLENKAYGINEIHRVAEGDICFVDHPKYYYSSLNSKATIIIINSDKELVPQGKSLLIAEDPFVCYLRIVEKYAPLSNIQTTQLSSAQVGKTSVVMGNVVIGNNVTIGEHCIIYPHVTILDNTEIGDHVIIQSGTVIGSDAFYYNSKRSRTVQYQKMLSCGKVVIEDYVEIGANCTIDRGVTAETRIGLGTKIDNLVHIGHEVIIGKNCLIAAQVGVAGVTIIEDNVTLWGQVGVSKTLTIGKNAVVLAQSGVSNTLEGNKVYFGYPAVEANTKRREIVWIKRIPELWNKIMSTKDND
ncbi:MAG: UDP-3-O-(3-hydroxymyristoyl)glucosamine N-acyltransferase [Phycisphaerales bacterium]|nr:UDP-3-O-(3-hydroxymyristoyl)glucosamine N-acyltransferase [Phycisphaerales bacterium]